MKRLTLCLMTCGEETEQECLAAIKPFRDEIEFQEVRNVYPQIKALNQMLDQVETEYLIPLDSDIILNENAFERIMTAIDKYAQDLNWHSILFKLYDTLSEKEILALKILRTKIMKLHPFREGATPDVEHFRRLTDEGYTCITNLLVKNPIGRHVVRGKHFCYYKYRDVYQTLRVHGWEWDSAVFMGGKTLMERSKKHYNYFIMKYLFTGNDDYLWCIAGMVDGITSPIENKSKTLDNPTYIVEHKAEIIDAYFRWYFEQYKSTLKVPLF